MHATKKGKNEDDRLRFARSRFVSLGKERPLRVHMGGTLRSHKGGDTIGTLGETKGDQTAGSLYLPLFGCNTRVTLYSPANFPNDLVVLPVFSLNTGKLGDKPKPV